MVFKDEGIDCRDAEVSGLEMVIYGSDEIINLVNNILEPELAKMKSEAETYNPEELRAKIIKKVIPQMKKEVGKGKIDS